MPRIANVEKPKCLQRSISLSMLRNGDKTLPGIYLACLDVRNNREETGNKPRILTAMDLRQRVCGNLVAESCTEFRLSHQTAAGEIYSLYIQSVLLPNFFLLHDTAKIVGSNNKSAITHPECLGLRPLASKMAEQQNLQKDDCADCSTHVLTSTKKNPARTHSSQITWSGKDTATGHIPVKPSENLTGAGIH
jgi:hypothetical protein